MFTPSAFTVTVLLSKDAEAVDCIVGEAEGDGVGMAVTVERDAVAEGTAVATGIAVADDAVDGVNGDGLGITDEVGAGGEAVMACTTSAFSGPAALPSWKAPGRATVKASMVANNTRPVTRTKSLPRPRDDNRKRAITSREPDTKINNAVPMLMDLCSTPLVCSMMVVEPIIVRRLDSSQSVALERI